MGWVRLGQRKWTHVHLCVEDTAAGQERDFTIVGLPRPHRAMTDKGGLRIGNVIFIRKLIGWIR